MIDLFRARKFISIAGALVFLLWSCGSDGDSGHHDSVEHHHDEHAGDAGAVQLNSGQKWQANPETTDGIAKMSSLVDALPASPTLDDYHALKTELGLQFDTILSKCTMQGEAHNQLHAYLMPLREKINGLDSDSLAACKETVEAIRQHLADYSTYFE